MIESKYVKVGGLVAIRVPGSNATINGITILEVHGFGFIGTQKDLKNAPVRLFSWDQITEMTFTPENPEVTMRRTAGKNAATGH